MAKLAATGLTRLKNAFFYSLAGLQAAWQEEAAFRQEVGLLLLGIPCAFWVGETAIERLLLISGLILILIVELINSALEAVVDRIGSEHHPLSGRAKDIGSAAVMVSLVWTSLVWLIILFK
jgi:diacylglycerol kinase (ATP)